MAKSIVPIFIDDIRLAGTSLEANDKVIEEMKHHFKLRDLGPTKFLLGIHIMHNLAKQTISHQYVINILKHFGMSDCKPVLTPMEPNLSLTSDMHPKSNDKIVEM